VLSAMGLPSPLGRSAVRVSLGWSSVAGDTAQFLDAWSALAVRTVGTAAFTRS
jgi:cysteine sulfinate desulfinase/cysteine desulfurase-like protein